MKNDLNDTKNKWEDEPIVIPDECGDTLWDAVLQQEIKSCEVKDISKNAVALLSSINAVQGSDTTKAK